VGFTDVGLELVLEEFEGDYRRSRKVDLGIRHPLPEKAEVLVQLTHVVRTSWPSDVFFGVLTSLVYPVQGKAIEQRGVLIVLAHLDELSFSIFVRLLED